MMKTALLSLAIFVASLAALPLAFAEPEGPGTWFEPTLDCIDENDLMEFFLYEPLEEWRRDSHELPTCRADANITEILRLARQKAQFWSHLYTIDNPHLPTARALLEFVANHPDTTPGDRQEAALILALHAVIDDDSQALERHLKRCLANPHPWEMHQSIIEACQALQHTLVGDSGEEDLAPLIESLIEEFSENPSTYLGFAIARILQLNDGPEDSLAVLDAILNLALHVEDNTFLFFVLHLAKALDLADPPPSQALAFAEEFAAAPIHESLDAAPLQETLELLQNLPPLPPLPRTHPWGLSFEEDQKLIANLKARSHRTGLLQTRHLVDGCVKTLSPGPLRLRCHRLQTLRIFHDHVFFNADISSLPRILDAAQEDLKVRSTDDDQAYFLLTKIMISSTTVGDDLDSLFAMALECFRLTDAAPLLRGRCRRPFNHFPADAFLVLTPFRPTSEAQAEELLEILDIFDFPHVHALILHELIPFFGADRIEDSRQLLQRALELPGLAYDPTARDFLYSHALQISSQVDDPDVTRDLFTEWFQGRNPDERSIFPVDESEEIIIPESLRLPSTPFQLHDSDTENCLTLSPQTEELRPACDRLVRYAFVDFDYLTLLEASLQASWNAYYAGDLNDLLNRKAFLGSLYGALNFEDPLDRLSYGIEISSFSCYALFLLDDFDGVQEPCRETIDLMFHFPQEMMPRFYREQIHVHGMLGRSLASEKPAEAQRYLQLARELAAAGERPEFEAILRYGSNELILLNSFRLYGDEIASIQDQLLSALNALLSDPETLFQALDTGSNYLLPALHSIEAWPNLHRAASLLLHHPPAQNFQDVVINAYYFAGLASINLGENDRARQELQSLLDLAKPDAEPEFLLLIEGLLKDL